MTGPRWDVWKTKAPPSDFVDRVMKEVDRDTVLCQRRRRVVKWTLVGAPLLAAAAAAVGGLWVHREVTGGGPTELATEPTGTEAGEMSAEVRTELDLSPGVSAVLEQGAHVVWTAGRIEQDRGDVFYRASRSQTIRVRTPAAEISGRGPAYRVKVPDTVDGAPPTVFVSVAQGNVAIESRAGTRRALGPGQYARVERHAIRTDREDDDGEIALAMAADRLRGVVSERLRALERRAQVAEATVATLAQAPRSLSAPQLPRSSAPKAPQPPASRPDPVTPSGSARPPILPRCDCDPRSPLCSCGSD